MKCPKCNGSGEIKHDWLPNETCHNCDGTGYVDMTNEEYIKSLDTEQLAKWLSNHNAFIYECGQKQNIPKVMYEEDLEWWLKQPHT